MRVRGTNAACEVRGWGIVLLLALAKKAVGCFVGDRLFLFGWWIPVVDSFCGERRSGRQKTTDENTHTKPRRRHSKQWQASTNSNIPQHRRSVCLT